MNHLSEQEIVSIAEHVAKTTHKDSILFLEKEYTMKSALDFLESWIKVSGYTYRHEELNDGQHRHMYLIQHDMGIKWSYLANICQFLFEELDKKKGSIAFVKTENTLAITVDSFCQWSEAVVACHRETTRLYYGCRRSITAWVFGMASTNNNNTKVGNVVMYLLIFSTFLLAIVLKDQNLYGLTSVAATSIKRYMRHRTVTLCGKKLKSLLPLLWHIVLRNSCFRSDASIRMWFVFHFYCCSLLSFSY
jgi:predicted hydrocarbon binding protein